MDTISADYTDKSGETTTYIGVAVNDLLGKAGPKDDATAVIFVADDGYTSELTLVAKLCCAPQYVPNHGRLPRLVLG
ncbi:MAG: hypothetical protein H8D78_14700 [Chloroflexi bacterium]|nr:hypothetical protein [Chloroflexota bacterium]